VEATVGPISNTVILIVLACLLGLLYLTQVTKTNALGYQLNELQQRHSYLTDEYDDLQVESARLQSLERVKNSQPAQALVSATPSLTIRN
jgi:cell division protein FtsL